MEDRLIILLSFSMIWGPHRGIPVVKALSVGRLRSQANVGRNLWKPRHYIRLFIQLHARFGTLHFIAAPEFQ